MFLDDYYDDKKRDCYYYEEVQDMGAHIPTCKLLDFGVTRCPGCKKYISRDDVDKRVMSIIEKRDNEEKRW